MGLMIFPLSIIYNTDNLAGTSIPLHTSGLNQWYASHAPVKGSWGFYFLPYSQVEMI